MNSSQMLRHCSRFMDLYLGREVVSHQANWRLPRNLGTMPAIKARPGAELDFDAEVARVHAAYKAELKRLYAAHQEQFGYEGRELVFACEAAEAKRAQVKAAS